MNRKGFRWPSPVNSGQQSVEFLILTQIGMINQLAGCLAGKVLEPLDLSMPEFLMLLHFSECPEEGKTIAQISQALQQLQPGVSKTVQKLYAKKLLRAAANRADGRSKFFYLTPQGARLYACAVERLMPGLRQAFEDFDAASLETLFGQLDCLKQWFDARRL